MDISTITQILKDNSGRYDLTQLLNGVVKDVQIVGFVKNSRNNYPITLHFEGEWNGHMIDDTIKLFRSEGNLNDLVTIHYAFLWLEKYNKQGGKNTLKLSPSFMLKEPRNSDT